MTDADIIKALECCGKLTHNGWGENQKICEEQCPYKANCHDEEKNINMISDTLDLINRQQADIERLNSCVKSEDEIRAIMKSQMEPMVKEITNEQIDLANKIGRTSGILEFAERLKNECAFECDVSLGYGRPCYEDAIPIIAIDNLVKEMAGE